MKGGSHHLFLILLVMELIPGAIGGLLETGMSMFRKKELNKVTSELKEAKAKNESEPLSLDWGDRRLIASSETNDGAIDLPLNWTVELGDLVDDDEEHFIVNPSIYFLTDESGSVEFVRAARLFSFHNSFLVDDKDEILEQIYNYRSSILIQSEPFLGDLTAPFDDEGVVAWGLDGQMPLKPADNLLLSSNGDVWGDLCEPKPHFEGSKLIRKRIHGPEDPKITEIPGNTWGISYSSYPLPSQLSENSKVQSCKWSDEAVFQMYLAPEGQSMASGSTADGHHLDCDFPSNINEKNWIPFIHDNKLYYIKSIEPMIVVLAQDDASSCQAVYESSAELLEPIASQHHVRGNANAVKYSENEYLALFHTLDESPGGGYTTRAFKFEAKPPFRVSEVSKPLPLYQAQEAFASSLTVQADKIIVGYGVSDKFSRVLVMSKSYMDSLFEDVYLQEPYGISMEERSLDRSFAHQVKFLEQKDKLADFFPRRQRFSAHTGQFAAVSLTEEFSYLHVWKSGGTTVQLQPGASKQRALQHPDIVDSSLLTFIRDPIDHFLSGWAEASMRIHENAETTPPAWKEEGYSERIDKYLEEVKHAAFHGNKRKAAMSAYTHSFPQANFLIRPMTGGVNEKVQIIGDISEMQQIMDLVGFDHDPEIHGRNSASNTLKKTHFPVRKELISDEVMLKICKFVAMDYFLFEFDPPAVCAQPGGPLDFH